MVFAGPGDAQDLQLRIDALAGECGISCFPESSRNSWSMVVLMFRTFRKTLQLSIRSHFALVSNRLGKELTTGQASQERQRRSRRRLQHHLELRLISSQSHRHRCHSLRRGLRLLRRHLITLLKLRLLRSSSHLRRLPLGSTCY